MSAYEFTVEWAPTKDYFNGEGCRIYGGDEYETSSFLGFELLGCWLRIPSSIVLFSIKGRLFDGHFWIFTIGFLTTLRNTSLRIPRNSNYKK